MSLSACCAAPSSAASLRAPTTAARGGVLDGHVSRGGAGRGSMGAAAARGLSTSSRLTTPARFLQQGYGGRLVRASRLRMECAITRVPSSDDEPREGNDPRVESPEAGDGKLPANSIQLPMPKRSAQLSFTCDKCEARTTRMVNPEVYRKGTMFVQCANCEVWHQLVDNLGLIYEFPDDDDKVEEK